jgi:hypothetical protein
MGCLWKFYGIISSRPRPLAVIAYKLCPKAQKFHGKSWIFYGNFMEKLGPVLDLYEISRENLWKIHGFSWIFPWKTHGMADP